MRTQIGIVGGGPAGLLLSHLLHLQGIDSVVLETRSRTHIENRIRAGVLEHGTADLLRQAGLGARLDREGLAHHGTILRFDGQSHRIDFAELTGKHVTVYGQHEVVRDLVAARLADGGDLRFEVSDVRVEGYEQDTPRIHFTQNGTEHHLDCDVIAGCDGFHGICRPTLPDGFITEYDRVYPFGWLGILAEVAPSSDELVYARHENGFALLSMRSPTIGRFYLQCRPDEDVAAWSDDRIWSELHTRLADDHGFRLIEGPIVQKGVTAMRSFVAAPMRCGRLFLLGDAAHIVPPTGAKGMNLAVADVAVLARALERHYRRGDSTGLDTYSDRCLDRVWKVQRFSWWMTTLLHRFDDDAPFDARLRRAELAYITSSRAAATTLAENYVGLPLTEKDSDRSDRRSTQPA
jgi:p-hydroxybenzoate 3-monooxygenase